MVLKIKQQDAIVLLLQARREYRLLRGKKIRGRFLDRLSEETGYDRKHLIKLLNSKKRRTVQKRGAPIKLTGEDVDLVRHIWSLSHYTNAEYLKQNIHRWLADYSSTLEERRRRRERVYQGKDEAYQLHSHLPIVAESA